MDVVRFIIEMVENSHVDVNDGWTTLQEVTTQNINPAVKNGSTPLHLAATNGHPEVCKLIMNEIANKNPRDEDRLQHSTKPLGMVI